MDWRLYTYYYSEPDDDYGQYTCPKCGTEYWENLSATPFCPECSTGFYGDVLDVPEDNEPTEE